MKIGRLEVIIHPAKDQVRRPYKGLICDVCGNQVRAGTKAEHIHLAHPGYGFVMRKYDNWMGNSVPECTACGVVTGGFGGLVTHYQKIHSELVTPREKKWQPQVQT